MFRILQQTIRTGIVSGDYPPETGVRGRPAFDFESWRDARPAAEVCPTGAISIRDHENTRTVTVDYGLCVFCGQCAGESVRMTNEFELATRNRRELIQSAEYLINADGTHGKFLGDDLEKVGRLVHERVHEVLGRSLSIRQVDAGSCNGCELEIGALNNPIYDIERFGIRFVASPRHADMLLVTGPVTVNMEFALLKTYRATPSPKLVVAVGACGISGGIFGQSYASRGGVDNVIPVDVYIPGCPPRPQALLHGILLALGSVKSQSPSRPSPGRPLESSPDAPAR